MLSIIIPTLNERNYLPLLLKSIKRQKINNYEIIVADAGSEDKTVEIAKKFGCKLISGGMPARGRNKGEKAAKGDLLLFLDADTILPENALENILKEFKKRKLEVAVCFLQPFGNDKIQRFFYDFFHNYPVLILEKILPNGAGPILIKRFVHQRINGFDEKIKFAEDSIYVRKASKHARFGVLKSEKVFYSQRRFQKEGWFRSFLKFIFAEFYMVFFGPIKSDILKYKFNHYYSKKSQ
jgi:glycosyltransferase involved in cell wall biosynthesis